MWELPLGAKCKCMSWPCRVVLSDYEIQSLMLPVVLSALCARAGPCATIRDDCWQISDGKFTTRTRSPLFSWRHPLLEPRLGGHALLYFG